jgi:hypothetical protein
MPSSSARGMACVWFGVDQPSSAFDIALCAVGVTTLS